MPGWRVVSRLALGPHPGRCGAVHAVGRGCRRVGGTRESLRWQPRRRRCAPGRAGRSQPGQPGDYEAEHEHPADADIRLGFPTWVMVSKDLILRPYRLEGQHQAAGHVSSSGNPLLRAVPKHPVRRPHTGNATWYRPSWRAGKKIVRAWRAHVQCSAHMR